MLEYRYNSLHAKMFRWFYNTSFMPNLCLYFWKSIIMWVLIIPYEIIVLPYQLFFLFLRLIKKEEIYDKDFEIPGSILCHTIIQGLIGVYFFLLSFFTKFSIFESYRYDKSFKNLTPYEFIGLMTIFMFIVMSIIWKIIDYQSNRKEKLLNEWISKNGKYPLNGEHLESYKSFGKNNLIINGIKSWYEKSCPKIKWIKD